MEPQNLTVDLLRLVVMEAYDRAGSSCPELRNEDINAIVEKYKKKIVCDPELRVWDVEELKACPAGTLFQHVMLGRCWIAERANGVKYMQLLETGQPISLNSNNHPWDKPMRMLPTT